MNKHLCCIILNHCLHHRLLGRGMGQQFGHHLAGMTSDNRTFRHGDMQQKKTEINSIHVRHVNVGLPPSCTNWDSGKASREVATQEDFVNAILSVGNHGIHVHSKNEEVHFNEIWRHTWIVRNTQNFTIHMNVRLFWGCFSPVDTQMKELFRKHNTTHPFLNYTNRTYWIHRYESLWCTIRVRWCAFRIRYTYGENVAPIIAPTTFSRNGFWQAKNHAAPSLLRFPTWLLHLKVLQEQTCISHSFFCGSLARIWSPQKMSMIFLLSVNDIFQMPSD